MLFVVMYNMPTLNKIYRYLFTYVSKWFRIEVARGDSLIERSASVQRSPTKVNFTDWRKS